MTFFLRAPKSLTAINMCLEEMEEFKGRDIAFVSDWLTKKVFKSCVVFLKVCMKSKDFFSPTFVSAEVFRVAIKQQ